MTNPTARTPAGTTTRIDLDSLIRQAMHDTMFGVRDPEIQQALAAIEEDDWDTLGFGNGQSHADHRQDPMIAPWTTPLVEFGFDSLGICAAIAAIEEDLLKHGLQVTISDAVISAATTLDDLRSHIADLITVPLGRRELEAMGMSVQSACA